MPKERPKGKIPTAGGSRGEYDTEETGTADAGCKLDPEVLFSDPSTVVVEVG